MLERGGAADEQDAPLKVKKVKKARLSFFFLDESTWAKKQKWL